MPSSGRIIKNVDDENLSQLIESGCWTPVETFGSSDYIKEFVRGEEGGDINQPEGLKLKIYEIIKRVSRVFLEISFRERGVKAHSGWLLVMKPFLKLFSGKLY